MSTIQSQWSQGVAPALVLLSEASESPMWDPEFNAVLDAVEERLDGVHVTTAVLGGRGPTVDDASAAGRDERALELSRAGSFRPVGVPFKHLIVVAQAARFDQEQTLSILRRTGYAEARADSVAAS